MRTKMKVWMLTLLGVLLLGTAAMADNDKPIKVSNLPVVARQVISKHFTNRKVALAKVESGILNKNYDVIFTNGDKVEFDKKGAWTEIDCKRTTVPTALVPAAIRAYVNGHYEGNRIVKIGREKRQYEVELSNGIELKFNDKFQVTDVDN